MKIEEQVCSLELAKKLKELGVKQESSFHWLFGDQGWSIDMMMDGEPYESDEGDKEFSAFTVAELGETLPRWLTPKNVEYWLNQARMSHGWAIGYKSMKHGLLNDEQIVDIDEADARAKMLIYLLENGLIETSKS